MTLRTAVLLSSAVFLLPAPASAAGSWQKEPDG